jgi:hypothetical protein
VTLEEALADPIYARKDAYAGHCGCSWLARIEPVSPRGGEYVFGDYEDAIKARFGPAVQALVGE